MGLFSRKIQPVAATDEEQLLQYRNSGDIALLGQLYEPYMPLVYGVCLKYLQDEEQSKDAVMQIFEDLIVKARQHEIKQFRGWLYVLARNHCLMQLRNNKKMPLINLEEVMEFNPFVHLDSESNEGHMQVLKYCLQKLNQAQQQSIQLFYYQEKCYKEIADATGYSLNEVKSYIQNGKRNLKLCIEKHREQ
jgi:RNA polymerase sigma factor (sigma-70 family)